MFRIVIKLLKKSAQLSWDAGDTIIREKYVLDAIENSTASIEEQILENELKKTQRLTLVENKGAKFGQINGLAVVGAGRYNEGAGNVIQLQGYLKLVDDPKYADFLITMTGKVISDGETNTMMAASKADVRTAIMRMYDIDIKTQAYVHIKFAGSDAEGPSAGITMTELIMHSLGEPEEFKHRLALHQHQGRPLSEFVMHSIPIRQDIAITGEINITEEMKGDVKVSAIGGAISKARGAKRYGILYVIIPSINREINVVRDNIVPDVKILGATTAREYFQLLRGDMNDTETSITEVTTAAKKYLDEKSA